VGYGSPDERELMQQVEAELKRLKVSDLLVQTLYTVSSLGYRRLGAEDRDLEQARLAIEALRGLVPVLSGSVPDEVVRDFNQVTANMQLAYVAAVRDAPTASGSEPQASPAGDEQPQAAPSDAGAPSGTPAGASGSEQQSPQVVDEESNGAASDPSGQDEGPTEASGSEPQASSRPAGEAPSDDG